MSEVQLFLTQQTISDHLNQIAKLFKDEGKPRLTLLVRNSAMKDADVLMTSDDLNKAVDAIRKQQNKELLARLEAVAEAAEQFRSCSNHITEIVERAGEPGWAAFVQQFEKDFDAAKGGGG